MAKSKGGIGDLIVWAALVWLAYTVWQRYQALLMGLSGSTAASATAPAATASTTPTPAPGFTAPGTGYSFDPTTSNAYQGPTDIGQLFNNANNLNFANGGTATDIFGFQSAINRNPALGAFYAQLISQAALLGVNNPLLLLGHDAEKPLPIQA